MDGAFSDYGRGARLPGQKMILAERARLRALEEEKKKIPPRYCKDCPEELDVFRLNKNTMMFVCNSFGCASWRNPQGYYTMRTTPTDEQTKIDKQLDGEVCEEDKLQEIKLERLRNKLILRDKRNPRTQDK